MPSATARPKSRPKTEIEDPLGVVRQYLWDQMEDQEQIHSPALISKTITWLSRKPELRAQVQELLLYRGVAELVGKLLKSSRVTQGGRSGAPSIIKLSHGSISRGEVERRAISRWETWFEKVGDSHVNLMHMTKENLLEAADTRERAANYDQGVANLWRKLADDLTGKKTVGDLFTADDIDKLYKEIS